MKKTNLLLLLTLLAIGAFAQTIPDPEFSKFAATRDSLERNAYYKRDIPRYKELFAEMQKHYRRLPAGSEKTGARRSRQRRKGRLDRL